MALAEASLDPGDYGEVFTRRWVVELILDLVGYTPDRDLWSMTIVEPSCGTGAFLVPITERLLASAKGHRKSIASLAPAVRAFDLPDANAERARTAVTLRIREEGATEDEAEAIAQSWVTTGDFLLADHPIRSADFVVGNPPYIRLESVPPATMDAYRRRCRTMRGRSDIYVGFFERGLGLLPRVAALALSAPTVGCATSTGRSSEVS